MTAIRFLYATGHAGRPLLSSRRHGLAGAESLQGYKLDLLGAHGGGVFPPTPQRQHPRVSLPERSQVHLILLHQPFNTTYSPPPRCPHAPTPFHAANSPRLRSRKCSCRRRFAAAAAGRAVAASPWLRSRRRRTGRTAVGKTGRTGEKKSIESDNKKRGGGKGNVKCRKKRG